MKRISFPVLIGNEGLLVNEVKTCKKEEFPLPFILGIYEFKSEQHYVDL